MEPQTEQNGGDLKKKYKKVIIELRTEEELQSLIAMLQNERNMAAMRYDHQRGVEIHFYMPFRVNKGLTI